MKNQEILRLLLQEKVQRALMINPHKMILECRKVSLSDNTLYDFVNYQRSYVKGATANKLFLATKAVLG
tara:strand:- start:350 stop:556 length:207 start_codon:yes stop_codon:yes gene_type:complete